MEIKNLERIPKSVQATIKEFIYELHRIYGDGLVSIFTYGSVSSSDYNPKTSDINIAVVLKDTGARNLKQALKLVRWASQKRITTPLFLTTSYIKLSLDTFPMEFMGMKDTHLVLFGEDVLTNVTANKEDLRRECEYQLKGKLVTIRQAYLEQALKRKGFERLIKASFRALIPIFQNILRIQSGHTPPINKEEMLSELGEEFEIDIEPFLLLLRNKKLGGRITSKINEEFLDHFLTQLERLANVIDRM